MIELNRISATGSVRSYRPACGAVMRRFAAVFSLLVWFPTFPGCSQGRREPADANVPSGGTAVEASPWPKDERRHDRFLGSQACRDCHQEIYAAYMAHPMAKSTRRCDDLLDAPYAKTAEFDRGWRHYSVDVDDAGVMSHGESCLDSAGNELYRQNVEVEFAVGSGQRGFSFLINRQGRLFQSSLTWYTKRGDWDLSPGYRADRHPRFERRVSDGCVVCHAGRPIPVAGGYHSYESGVFAELAIGCERCHGPGAAHVAYQSEGTTAGDDPIVNPADLAPLARESVCYQCHLHGLERILRTGREELDFRPGDVISDVWAIFARGSGIKDSGATTAVSQVEQMVASRCFTASQGELGCTSCHDPHRLPTAEERVVFYRDRCVRCHGDAKDSCSLASGERLRRSPDDSCIECHMPRLSADDVPHTSQTDHRILKAPLAKGLETLAAPTDIELFQPQDFPVPDNEAQRAFGLMLSRKALGTGSPRYVVAGANALAPLANAATDDVAVLAAQAVNLLALGDPGALELAKRGHALAPGNESLLETLVIFHERREEFAECLKYADQFLELYSGHSLMWERKARALAGLGRTEEAVDAAERALQINPTATANRELLISLAKRMGRTELAGKQETLLRALQKRMEASSDGDSGAGSR